MRRTQALAVREAVRLLRHAGFEVIVSCSTSDGSLTPMHWLIHAEQPQGMRHKGDEKLARRIAERVAKEEADNPIIDGA